ncbi:C40 family peptidase [Streptomyces sp. SID8352]|uniref:NlpC/P60 family protein n=1 Tax=Streptomyces sp. SID8352 TaxID=2690338 RepID=UPI00136D56DA|nr:hypothetical protein [Streptomyces sp. SID8352]
MSGRFPRLVCTAALTAGLVLAPLPAGAAPGPGGAAGGRTPAELLTDLQRLYREAEKATETYNGTAERLGARRAEVKRLDTELARARTSLGDSRAAAGSLARQQYRDGGALSLYLRLLLARDPQGALEQGHVLTRLARERAGVVGRLARDERRTEALARRARTALGAQLALAAEQRRQRDEVRRGLADVERLLAALTPEQRAGVAALERSGTALAQERLLASGALGDDGKPSEAGRSAVRFAVRQLGKPYVWGAQGPSSYDCSGLTSAAWRRAGRAIPRTSQQQWARLRRVPMSALRPGDLVVYFPEATHVALYLGGGLVVQAPRPGARVKVSPVAANPVLGAVRPDPEGVPLRRYTPPSLPAGATAGSDAGFAG